MIVVFIAAFFCVLNISLWITFFIKFRKLFSTEDIIASTREEMNNMISDINHNAGRNIELIEDRIRQLKMIAADADRRIETARRELENQKANLSYQQKMNSALNAHSQNINVSPSQSALKSQNMADMYSQPQRNFTGSVSPNMYQNNDARFSGMNPNLNQQMPGQSNAASNNNMQNPMASAGIGVNDGMYGINSRAAQQYLRNKNISSGLQGGNQYELTDEGRSQSQKVVQGDLFASNEIENSAGTTFTVENDGSSYASVPVYGGNVNYIDNPIQPQMSKNEHIHNLYMSGHEIEEIANETNCSITEVQMVLEMAGDLLQS